MKPLRPRPLRDAGEIARVVVGGLEHLEAGLRLLARDAWVGEAKVDVIAADAVRRAVLIGCDVIVDPGRLLPLLEAAGWWRMHGAGAAQALGDGAVDTAAPCRALIVAARFTDRARHLLRGLGPWAPAAVECRLFEDGGELRVCFETLDGDSLDASGAAGERAPGLGSPLAPATASGGVTGAPAGARADRVDQAAGLIERLERLRLTEVVR